MRQYTGGQWEGNTLHQSDLYKSSDSVPPGLVSLWPGNRTREDISPKSPSVTSSRTGPFSDLELITFVIATLVAGRSSVSLTTKYKFLLN